VEECLANALTLAGTYYSVSEVIEEVEKNRAFYRRSGGGVTISGGEPLLQGKFVLNLLKECRALGIHTALDTTGFSGWPRLARVVEYVDLFLYDLKSTDSRTHQMHTGADNNVILENIKRIDSFNIPIIFRIPVIPGYTDGLKNLKESARFCSTIGNLERVDLLPYNPMSESKYRRLYRKYPLKGIKPPTSEEMEKIKRIFASCELKTQIGG
jgi:pyruvate formate lyase activating enzyme